MALEWKSVPSNSYTTGPFRDNYTLYPAQEYYYNNANIIWATFTQYGWTLNAIAGAMGVMDYESGGFNPGIGEMGGWPLPTGTTGNWDVYSHPSGLSLAQWTAPNGFYPTYDTTDPNPLLAMANKFNVDWYDGAFQCLAINHCNDPEYTDFYAPSVGAVTQLWGWRQGSHADYHIVSSWNDYRTSTLPPEELAKAYLACVEGVPGGFEPDGSDYRWRQQQARYWYDTFYGKTPDPDVPVYPDDYPPGPGPGPTPGPGGMGNKMPLWMMLRPWPFR